MRSRKLWLAVAAALVAIAGVITAIFADDNGQQSQPAQTQTVTTIELGGPGPKTTLRLGPTGQRVLRQAQGNQPGASDLDPAEGNLKSESRLTPADRRASQSAAKRTTSGSDKVPQNQTAASPSQRGCRTTPVRNQSSRGGARPAIWVLHYTVSPNRPGRGDVDGITAFFNSSRSQASSNYVIDNEGNCNFLVAESQKSWTETNFNPWGISVEVINTGKESTYAGSKGLAKIGLVISDSAKRWGIPLRRGATSGCRVVRSGIVDHRSLGPCGGGHFDIAPPYSVSQVIAAAQKARGGGQPVSTHDRIPAPAKSSPCTQTKSAGLGDFGPGVKILKGWFNNFAGQHPKRYKKTPNDDQFGPRTASNTKTYQRRHKLDADGIVGPQTWRSICQAAR